jgi:uncharacterized membrane protein (DUF106 family)
MRNISWEHIGALIACLTALYGFLIKYFPPEHIKAEAMAKAQSQGSITAEELMKALRENNREILTQIMGVIKEGFLRMENTDEKIAEAIRQQVTAFTEMGFKFQNREQVTETLHRTGHEHMKRIEDKQGEYTRNQLSILAKMDDIAKELKR